jgi:uncharacterized protein YndB with AHSA1/START domain
MGAPTTAEATVEIDAAPADIYDLVTDVSRMGEWSPECRRCEWLGDPGQVGSTFKGHNRSGPARWSTVARVLVADRPREFSFATLYKDDISTRWTYRFEGEGPTKVTESFEAVRTPPLIGLAERLFLRNRQAQLEDGMAKTLAAIKAVAEKAGPS